MIVIGLGEDLKNAVIKLRKQYRLKVPDAIFCAATLMYDAVLLSNDVQMARVTEISVDTVQIRLTEHCV